MTTATDQLERVPPHDLAAERAVIGSMVLDSRMIDEVALILREDDFYDDAHAAVYRAVISLQGDGKQVDVITLTDRLKTQGDFERIGGTAYLAKVLQSVPTAAHCVYYAQIVRDKSLSRALIDMATDTLVDVYGSDKPSGDVLEVVERRMFAVADRSLRRDPTDARSLLGQALEELDARCAGSTVGVSTGFSRVDEQLGGLRPGQLVVLAARPGMGKSAWAMNVAEYVALESEVSTLYVSLEMAQVELGDRLLSGRAKVPLHRMRAGTINVDQRAKLVEAASELSQAPLFVVDDPSISIRTIAAQARRLKRRKGLGLIVVDYLQLIDPEDARVPREQQVALMTRRLKALAKEIDVPILCLCQLNRRAEESGGRPKLSQLRESGAIEQDADIVCFIHRAEYYLTGEEAEAARGQAELIVAKHRNGPQGDVPLVWRAEYTRFETAAERWQQQEAF